MATVRTVIEVCNRCPTGHEKKAIAKREFCIDGDWYATALCFEHNEMFDRSQTPWRITAELIEAPVRERRSEFFKEEDIRATRRIAELRAKASQRVAVQSFAEKQAARIDGKLKAEAEQHAWNLIPGAKAWSLSGHARDRMAEYEYGLDEVLFAATAPATNVPGEGGCRIYRRDDIEIVVNEITKTVRTILPPKGRLTHTPEERIAL